MYAVVFSSQLAEGAGDDTSAEGYDATAQRMAESCASRDGFVGIESVRDPDGHGITVCLWESLEAIDAWRADLDHAAARARGREEWYSEYRLLTCEIIRQG